MLLKIDVVIPVSLWLFKRQADIRWAREVALPEIEHLIDENDVWSCFTFYRLFSWVYIWIDIAVQKNINIAKMKYPGGKAEDKLN